MAKLKTRRPELELIRQAGERLAYRTNSTFVLNDDAFDARDDGASDNQRRAGIEEKKTINFD